MHEDLLQYYERELGFLRELGADFARAHPKIAGRLRLGADSVEDPHVARLIESIALLNARIRRTLDDDYPQLAESLLSVVAPHHLAPIPAMSIVQFECVASLTAPYDVPAGTMIETAPVYGTPCQFRTVYDVKAWPIQLESASLFHAPFQAPPCRVSQKAAAVLRLRFETSDGQCPIGELGIDSIRLFLNGQPARVQQAYAALLDEALAVTVASGPNDPDPLELAADAIRPVGFGRREGMLPFSGKTHPGSRLLFDLFTFPAKFQFVDLVGLEDHRTAIFDDRLDIYIYLESPSRELEQSIRADTFVLGCTPVVNLFSRTAEPIVLDEQRADYHIVPDARHLESHETYSIDSVTAMSRAGEVREYRPFYGIDHSGHDADGFWFATRRDAVTSDPEGDSGTEVDIALVDLDLNPRVPGEWILKTEVTCLNRDVPGKLPFGGDEPRMTFSEGGGGIGKIRCLTQLPNTVRPPQRRGALWKAISQLSLNHLSISGDEDGAEVLREILRVHDPVDDEVTRSVIASITSVSSRPAMIRIQEDGRSGFARGTEIRVQIDEARLGGCGLHLFSLILERFLASYCSANSFVQLVTATEQEEKRWPPRSGHRALV